MLQWDPHSCSLRSSIGTAPASSIICELYGEQSSALGFNCQDSWSAFCEILKHTPRHTCVLVVAVFLASTFSRGAEVGEAAATFSASVAGNPNSAAKPKVERRRAENVSLTPSLTFGVNALPPGFRKSGTSRMGCDPPLQVHLHLSTKQVIA
jgi:hypothetical protein